MIGATTESALTVGPGDAERIGEGTTVLGSAGASPEACNRIARLLVEAGFRASTAYDIRPHLWGKLIANAAINPVAALLDRPNGVVLSDEHAGEVARSLAQEAATVANAMRIPLPFTDPWSYVRTIVQQTAESGQLAAQRPARRRADRDRLHQRRGGRRRPPCRRADALQRDAHSAGQGAGSDLALGGCFRAQVRRVVAREHEGAVVRGPTAR